MLQQCKTTTEMQSNELLSSTQNTFNRERDEFHFGKSSFQTALDSKVMFISFFIFYCYFDFILIFVLIFNSNQLLFQKTNKQ